MWYESIGFQPMALGLKGHPALAAWEIVNELEGSVYNGKVDPNKCFDTTVLAGSGAGWTGKWIPMQRFFNSLHLQYNTIVIKIQFDKGHSLRFNMASCKRRNTLKLFWANLSKLLRSFVFGRYLRFVNWQLSALRLTDPSTLLTVGSWSEKTQTSAFAGTCKLT